MKLQLEPPFKDDWKSGYLRYSKKDGRGRVDLFNSNSDRTTITYARYAISVYLGRYLKEDEEVDHINTDNTDDRIENLQILDINSHRAKTSKERTTGRSSVVMRCPICRCNFEKEIRQTHLRKTGKTGTMSNCSRACGGKAGHLKRIHDEELLELIGQEQIIEKLIRL